MKKGGFFLVYRGVFDDFKPKTYSELEAWLWLIGAAEYENGNIGEIETSLSELARTWNWTYGKKPVQHNAVKVKRFLAKMALQDRLTVCKENVKKNELLCKGKCKTEIRIKITNYTTYQRRDKSFCKDVCKGSEVSLSQKCKEEPLFVEQNQQPASPKQETIKKKQLRVQAPGGACCTPPGQEAAQVVANAPAKTKAQIKREKAAAKNEDRLAQLAQIKAQLAIYVPTHPDINIDMEYAKMEYWVLNNPTGKIRTDIHGVWKRWIDKEQIKAKGRKLFQTHQKPEPSILEQMRAERAKRQRIEEEIKHAF